MVIMKYDNVLIAVLTWTNFDIAELEKGVSSFVMQGCSELVRELLIISL